MPDQMTFREMNLRVFRREEVPHVFFQPRIEPWLQWQRDLGELAPGFRDEDIREIYRRHGFSMRYMHYGTGQPSPLSASYPDEVKISEERTGDRIVTRYDTPHGPLFQTNQLTVDKSWRMVDFPVKTPEDLPRLAWLVRHRELSFSEDKFAAGSEWMGDLGEPQFFLPKSPYFALAQQRMKYEDFIFALMDAPGAVRECMEAIDEGYDRLYEEIISSGAPKILNLGENIAMAYLSPQYFEEYCIPWYEKRMGQLRSAGMFSHIHIDGYFRALLPYLRDLPFDGLEALTPEPQGDVSVEEMHEAVGDKILLDGIPAILFMRYHPREEFEACVEQIVKLFHPRLVLGISDEIPQAADEEGARRLEWVAEYCRSHGAPDAGGAL